MLKSVVAGETTPERFPNVHQEAFLNLISFLLFHVHSRFSRFLFEGVQDLAGAVGVDGFTCKRGIDFESIFNILEAGLGNSISILILQERFDWRSDIVGLPPWIGTTELSVLDRALNGIDINTRVLGGTACVFEASHFRAEVVKSHVGGA